MNNKHITKSIVPKSLPSSRPAYLNDSEFPCLPSTSRNATTNVKPTTVLSTSVPSCSYSDTLKKTSQNYQHPSEINVDFHAEHNQGKDHDAYGTSLPNSSFWHRKTRPSQAVRDSNVNRASSTKSFGFHCKARNNIHSRLNQNGNYQTQAKIGSSYSQKKPFHSNKDSKSHPSEFPSASSGLNTTNHNLSMRKNAGYNNAKQKKEFDPSKFPNSNNNLPPRASVEYRQRNAFRKGNNQGRITSPHRMGNERGSDLYSAGGKANSFEEKTSYIERVKSGPQSVQSQRTNIFAPGSPYKCCTERIKGSRPCSTLHGSEKKANKSENFNNPSFKSRSASDGQKKSGDRRRIELNISSNNLPDSKIPAATATTEGQEPKSTRKKKRPSKIKRQTAFQTGKLLILTPELHSRITGQLTADFKEQKPKEKEVFLDIGSSSEYPELSASVAVRAPKQIKVQSIDQHAAYVQKMLEMKTCEADIEHEDCVTDEADVKKEPKVPRQPVQFIDLLNKSKELKSQKKEKYETISELVGTPKNKINQVKGKGPNVLDSSAPIKKRGKEREKPKNKRHTTLKKIILQERALKKMRRETKENSVPEEITNRNDSSSGHMEDNSDNLNSSFEIDGKAELPMDSLVACLSSFSFSNFGTDNTDNENLISYQSQVERDSNAKNLQNSEVQRELGIGTNCIPLVPEYIKLPDAPNISMKDEEFVAPSKSDQLVINDCDRYDTSKPSSCYCLTDYIDFITKFADTIVEFCITQALETIEKGEHDSMQSENLLSRFSDLHIRENIEAANHSNDTDMNFSEIKRSNESDYFDNTSPECTLKIPIEGNIHVVTERLVSYDSCTLEQSAENTFLLGPSQNSGFVIEESLGNEIQASENSITMVPDSGLKSIDESEKSKRLEAVSVVLHTRNFREYCTHLLSKDLDECVISLISDLYRFQDRVHKKDPSKLKAYGKRRMVYGIKEVSKHLKLKKIKCVIVAPNLENIKSKGGLNDTLTSLINLGQEFHVPCVFASDRKKLGKINHKPVPVSCIGIFNYEGAEAHFKRMMEIFETCVKDYKEVCCLLENLLTIEDINSLLYAAENSPNKLLQLRLKILQNAFKKDEAESPSVSLSCNNFAEFSTKYNVGV